MSTVRGSARYAAAVLSGVLVLACRGGGSSANDLPDAGVSPQAKAEPAQLENIAVSSLQPLPPDAGPPPVPLRSDEEAPPDTLAKELAVWEIEAVLRTLDIPPAFRGPETAIAAVDAVKKRTEPRLAIDLTAARLRIRLTSAGFLLPQDTELRARSDLYGHFLLLPNARQYRIVPSGALRALLGERRIDVEPLAPASPIERGEGARRLGYRTRRVEVTNRAATATFELARLPEAGEGGVLLCRALLDLMDAPPSTPACGVDEVPLHVEWRWATKGGLTFEVATLAHHVDLAATAMAAPPPGLSFTAPSLPESGAAALVDQTDLVAFRTAPADIPPPASPTPRASPGMPSVARPPVVSAASGLTLTNASDEVRVAWLDGAPVAWIAPGGMVAFPSLLRGRYGFAWRTFLGDAYDAPITITVPVALSASAGDAGAP